MAYAICKVNVTKSNYSIDGKEHKRKVYYAGRDSISGFGMTYWDKKSRAVLFDDVKTASRYARNYGGTVVEI